MNNLPKSYPLSNLIMMHITNKPILPAVPLMLFNYFLHSSQFQFSVNTHAYRGVSGSVW